MYFEYDEIDNFYYLGEEPLTNDTFREWIESEPKIVACDIEGIPKERLASGFCLVTSPKFGFYFPMWPVESQAVPWYLLKDPSVTKVYHNGLFDLDCLSEFDVDRDIEDTMVMARLLCHNSNELADLSDQYGIACPRTSLLLKEHRTKLITDIPEHIVARHCILHGMATIKLYQEFLPRIYQKDLYQYYREEMATYPVMMEMSERGILIDQEERERIEYCLEEDLQKAINSCNEIAMFNPGSPQQVAYVLAERGAYSVFPRLPFTKNKYGKPTSNLSTDVNVLEAMTDPLAALILVYRQKKKLLGTYIKPWEGEERARCKYHLDAATGRPSSTGGGVVGFRNLQNIPGMFSKTGEKNEYNVRGVLLPDSGVWSDADFSQVEPRSLAFLSGDKVMQHIFQQPKYLPSGEKNPEADIHLQVALFMDKPRKVGKIANLAVSYGGTPETVMEIMKTRDRRFAEEVIIMWGQKFPQAMDWIRSQQETALRTRVAYSAFGRPMKIGDDEGDGRVKRCAVDYPCQGTAADILKRGLVGLHNKGIDLALQVHDQYLMDGFVPAHELEFLKYIGPFETPIGLDYRDRFE